MKKIIFFYGICLFVWLHVAAQGNYSVKVNQNAHYSGGEFALAKYFLENITYSPEAIQNKLSGTAILSFTVKTDSTITDIIPLSNIGFNIEDEVSVWLKKLKYAPAMANGVAYQSNLIINVNIRATEKIKTE
ncbi:MAG: energy transducer TonB [Bacteroidales bacterium]|jgi:hypothetical protein|nr:energy transducer TonB [Bacteroidales bacterium]MDD4214770.1 energy transducer TonB [Bacteroidales bacterium]